MPAEGDLLFVLLLAALSALRALLLAVAWFTALYTTSPARREVAYRLVCLVLTPARRRGSKREPS
ncbi:MAG TPA: hypothetical protein VFO16_06585 [Pseudonocardiaceae bacterium]|nr:hypothetical protein [Pseudonocardiaceae bacterium]